MALDSFNTEEKNYLFINQRLDLLSLFWLLEWFSKLLLGEQSPQHMGHFLLWGKLFFSIWKSKRVNNLEFWIFFAIDSGIAKIWIFIFWIIRLVKANIVKLFGLFCITVIFVLVIFEIPIPLFLTFFLISIIFDESGIGFH